MASNTAHNPEQRLTFRLLSYWNRIRGQRPMPSLADVNIQEIADMWHYTFTIALGASEHEHRFQYFGPELATIFGTDYSDFTLDEALGDSPILANTIGFYDKVVAGRSPLSDSSEFFLDGKEVRYRSLIVPLSSTGQQVDYVLGTTNYKIFG